MCKSLISISLSWNISHSQLRISPVNMLWERWTFGKIRPESRNLEKPSRSALRSIRIVSCRNEFFKIVNASLTSRYGRNPLSVCSPNFVWPRWTLSTFFMLIVWFVYRISWLYVTNVILLKHRKFDKTIILYCLVFSEFFFTYWSSFPMCYRISKAS